MAFARLMSYTFLEDAMQIVFEPVVWAPRSVAAHPHKLIDSEYEDIVALLMDYRVDDSAETLRLTG